MLITGIRAPTDVMTLRKRFHDDFVLICVRAHERKRFQRLLSRQEPRDPKTWQQFLEQDRAEEKIFQLDESCRLADYRIDNDGTVEELNHKIDRIIMKTLNYS
jgi:dephospho-CoA kinase